LSNTADYARGVLSSEEITGLRKALNEDREIIGKRIKFLYLAQKSAQPPTFALGVKDVKMVNPNTRKYVENFFRKTRDFTGAPIVINYENARPAAT